MYIIPFLSPDYYKEYVGGYILLELVLGEKHDFNKGRITSFYSFTGIKRVYFASELNEGEVF